MKYFIIFLLIFGLFSCGTNNENNIIDNSNEVINNYSDTLTNSIQDAKKVKEQYDERNKNLENTINTSK